MARLKRSIQLTNNKIEKMENIMINVNDVKKELYKSKTMAKISHYTSGNIYYTVELADGTYQFPISTVDKYENDNLYVLPEELGGEDGTDYKLFTEEIYKKSSDLGTTSFENEMKGSDLNRWIAKAINSNDFIKIR